MTKVKLRTKPISGGRQSLYLDFYPPIVNPVTGKQSRREFLKLYLLDKPKGELEKQHNKETKALAENIKARRQLEIQSENYGFLPNKKKKSDFIEYFEGIISKKEGTTAGSWKAVLVYLKDFTGGSLSFANLNEQFCNNFREYLFTAPSNRSSKTTLTQNSVHNYFTKFKTALKQAYEEDYLQVNLNAKIKAVKQVEVEKSYLSLDELQALVKTDCKVPVLKQAAIFSALTGLRFSDIEKLTWAEVRKNGDNYFLHFLQKKTKGQEILPISEQAFTLLGERKDPTRQVFDGLEYSGHLNNQLKFWVLKAGIQKDITFHSFRHTYATLQLSLGTDIYTVSKMLGHRELKSTQVYAKIVDEKKQEAANKIKLDL